MCDSQIAFLSDHGHYGFHEIQDSELNAKIVDVIVVELIDYWSCSDHVWALGKMLEQGRNEAVAAPQDIQVRISKPKQVIEGQKAKIEDVSKVKKSDRSLTTVWNALYNWPDYTQV